MSDHERLIKVTQKWDDEYRNLLMTARALLARAETAERAAEGYAMQGMHLRGALQYLIDATAPCTDPFKATHILVDGSAFKSARAAAVSVLKGPEL